MKIGVFGSPGGRLILSLVLLVVACRPARPPGQTPAPQALQAGVLVVSSKPEGALLRVNGQASGQTPARLELAAGRWRLELSKPGYEPWSEEVCLDAGGTLAVAGVLPDVAPPTVHLGDLPAQLAVGTSLLLQARAEDNDALAWLALSIDGQRQVETQGEPLSFRWDTAKAAPGSYVVRVEARDAAGNLGHREARLQLFASSLPGASPPPGPTPAAPAAKPVAIHRGSLTIPTYQYHQALQSDPASLSYPYPVLDRSRVGPPLPVTYETVILENEYLRLVFLPALGGRLYQCVFLPTGQNVFYNNAVLKPSHWGPPEMGWWLAAGGMEWCLPVDEHGYVTAEPWSAETLRGPGGGATIILRHTERTRNIRAAVSVALHPGQASFTVTSRLENPDAEPKRLAYWLNAMVSLGNASLSPKTEFLLPASQVIVHSTGDDALGAAHTVLPWPVAGGRDLSRYESWRNWLGVFAPAASAGWMGAYSHDSRLGIVRVFPLRQAPGVKLFAFGRDFAGTASYADDGSQYAELWGGLTPTFWDLATLPAHGSAEWTETWFPIHGLGGASYASAQAALVAIWDGQDVRLVVATPRPRNLLVTLTDEGGELYRQAGTARPEQPFATRLRPERAAAGNLVVRVLSEDGGLLAEYAMGPR